MVRVDVNGKKSTTKFTIKDSQEAFVFVGQTHQQLSDQIEFLEKKMERIQPFILATGDCNFNKFENFYVYLDGTKLVFNNFLRAVDICFKIFHIFNLEYPQACSQIWNFIESYFYKMNFNDKKQKSTKLRVILDEIDKT